MSNQGFLCGGIQMILLGGGNSETGEQPSAMANAVGVFASFNRFMRSLSQ